jgi:hypothetical protein
MLVLIASHLRQEKHGIQALLQELFSNLVVLAPLDPVQYAIDSVEYSAEFAKLGLHELVAGAPL